MRYGGLSPTDAEKLRSEQPWLTQEYGRLFSVINRWGTMSMGSPALGITSHDVIQDAIHDLGDFDSETIARLTIQHLDMVIGRLSGGAEEAERERNLARERREREAARKADERAAKLADPDRWYRVTSPLYWGGRLLVLARWLVGTWSGRIVAGIGILVGAVVGGIASGVAQGWFESLSR